MVNKIGLTWYVRRVYGQWNNKRSCVDFSLKINPVNTMKETTVLDFTRSKKMKKVEDANFGINVGDTLQLNFEHDKKLKHYARLIGYLPNKSLLVTCPRCDGKQLSLKVGQSVQVRMLSDSSVLGFNTRILCLAQQPYSYLHLEYPFSTGKIVVRRAQRIMTKLIVSVLPENIDGSAGKPVSAASYDISTCGALLESPVNLGNVGDLLTLTMRLSFGRSSEYITVPAMVRHVRFDKHPETKKRVYFHGVEFRILEQHDNIVLHGYIYQQMAHQSI